APGGIANLAVAAARLGLGTSLAAGFSTDVYGDWMWRTLRDQEHIDLTYSRQFRNWHTPVTVSMAYGGDRAMVTHGHPAPPPPSDPLSDPPPTPALILHLGGPLPRERESTRPKSRPVSISDGVLCLDNKQSIRI